MLKRFVGLMFDSAFNLLELVAAFESNMQHLHMSECCKGIVIAHLE